MSDLVPNNKYMNYPAKMNDGRLFTDYGPNVKLNTDMKNKNKITSSYEYRQYLMKNADDIIKQQNQNLRQKNNGECML